MNPLSNDNARSILRKYGVRPSKKRGQTFLTDEYVAAEIVSAADLHDDESVLEIGGGLGILTVKLAELAGSLTVVEIEPGLVQALSDALSGFTNVTILQGNALSIDLPEVDKVVSNLPYNISSDMTFRIIEEVRPTLAVLMYQREFAERLLAEPGSRAYSRLTVDATYLAEFEEILHIPATAFYPVPAVDSTVVRMKLRSDGPRAQDSNIFRWMARGIYSYPNKKVRNALSFWLRTLKREKTLRNEILQKSQLDGDMRLRSLSLDLLVSLADAILELVNEGVLPDPRSA